MGEQGINDRIKFIWEILSTKFEEIKNLSLGNIYNSRIPLSFYDYDEITQGLPKGG